MVGQVGWKMTGTEWEHQIERWLKALPLASFRNEPKVQGGYKMAGGTPDYTALLAGRCHLIECKLETSTAFVLGQLTAPVTVSAATGKETKEKHGISSEQSATLTRWESHGGYGWIAARLEVSALAPRGKQAKLLDEGRKAQVIQRIVPWRVWRKMLEEGKCSVPYLEFAGLGYPLNSAQELIAAISAAKL